jgi:phosphotriesterase-related protein
MVLTRRKFLLIGWGDFENYADSIEKLKRAALLHRVLISHDAGWYKPDEPLAEFQGYTNIFTKLVPLLKSKGLSDIDIQQLLEKNPVDAFAITVRNI